jgi:hypothetical protein
LRGNISEFILITDGKYHDSSALDILVPITDAIYIMDKAYVDFDALSRINQTDAFFVTRAKSSIKYKVTEQNFCIDKTHGLRADKTIMLTVYGSKKL